LSRKPPTPRWTYGLRRSSILAALGNAVLLLVAVGGIAWEAVRRFRAPGPVAGGTVMAVAGVGIVVNAVTALLFMSGRKQDVNIEGAFLHMAADAAVSLGVLVAGAVIAYTGWQWLDPVVSLVIVAVITAGTWGLLRRSVALALDAVPEGIDPAAVRACLAGLPNVTAVHDLHIWPMSTTEAALTVHLVAPGGTDGDRFLAFVAKELHDRFGIEHTTVQVERGDQGVACKLSPDHVV
jgi:cobalt-zinc-cadmium efflux system protein